MNGGSAERSALAGLLQAMRLLADGADEESVRRLLGSLFISGGARRLRASPVELQLELAMGRETREPTGAGQPWSGGWSPLSRTPRGELAGSLERFGDFDVDPRGAAVAPIESHSTLASLDVSEAALLEALQRAAKEGLARRAGAATPPAEGAPGRALAIFARSSPEACIELLRRAVLLVAEPGDVVIRQGERPRSVFLILEGGVQVVREDRAGARLALATLGPGELFGERALLSGAPRAASVESRVTSTALLEISLDVLGELSPRYPSVGQAVARLCVERVLLRALGRAQSFMAAGPGERRELLGHFVTEDLAQGTILATEGTPVSGLCVVLSGELAVTRGGELVATLREGDLFGERSLVRGDPATASAHAVRRTTVLRLPRERFEEMMRRAPEGVGLPGEVAEASSFGEGAVPVGSPGDTAEATWLLV